MSHVERRLHLCSADGRDPLLPRALTGRTFFKAVTLYLLGPSLTVATFVIECESSRNRELPSSNTISSPSPPWSSRERTPSPERTLDGSRPCQDLRLGTPTSAVARIILRACDSLDLQRRSRYGVSLPGMALGDRSAASVSCIRPVPRTRSARNLAPPRGPTPPH